MHDFLRKSREELLKARHQLVIDTESEQDDSDIMAKLARGMTKKYSKAEQMVKVTDDALDKSNALSNKDDEEKLKLVTEYKEDFLKFFEMKLLKDGGDKMGGHAAAQATASSNGIKLPKRKKPTVHDSVEVISQNVQALIKFGREQSAKMLEIQQISTAKNKIDLMNVK